MTSTTDPGSLGARVSRGAELLDRVRPGWAQEISQNKLLMSSCDKCILGQLYGNYIDGYREVLKPLSSRQLFAASEFGFTLRGEDQVEDTPQVRNLFTALADAWRAAIRERLDEGGP